MKFCLTFVLVKRTMRWSWI